MLFGHEGLTGRIIGAGITVHKALGPGFVESVYENALSIELGRLDIPFQRQLQVPVYYRDTRVGTHRLDLLVDGVVVVELKAVKEILNPHFVVLRSYLRAADSGHGLILNFAQPTLEVKRVALRDNSV